MTVSEEQKSSNKCCRIQQWRRLQAWRENKIMVTRLCKGDDEYFVDPIQFGQQVKQVWPFFVAAFCLASVGPAQCASVQT